MSEEPIPASPKEEKSKAPQICGIIGFILSIPNMMCSFLCAAMATATDLEANFDQAYMNSVKNGGNINIDTAKNSQALQGLGIMGTIALIEFFLSIMCFIFCFRGKTKAAKKLGIITVGAAIFIIVSSCIFFSFCGIASGVFFLIQGIKMIQNGKKC